MTTRRAHAAVLALALIASACGSGGPKADVREAGDVGTSTAPAAPDGDGGLTASADGDSSPRDSTPTGATPSGQGSPTPTVAADGVAAEVFVPPGGRYIYDTSGFTESGSGATYRRSDAPRESTDDITVERQGSTTTVTTSTSYGSSGLETVVAVTGVNAHLMRLTYWSTNAGVRTEQAVTPQPEILVVRLPYVVGDRWESAWRDPSIGIQGAGWGAVLRREAAASGRGRVDAVVLQLHQRLQGPISGELDVTSWVDPATGVVVRQVLITDLSDATGASHSETTRVLRAP